MKLTLSELKRIIKEAVTSAPVELTEDPQSAHDVWPHVTWNGLDIIDKLYPAIQAEVEPTLKDRGYSFQECYLGYIAQDDTFVMGWDVWPPEDHDADDYDEDEDGPGGMGGSGYHAISSYARVSISTSVPVNKNSNVYARVLRDEFGGGVIDCDALFYKRSPLSGGYKEVHEKFPDILDLRLD